MAVYITMQLPEDKAGLRLEHNPHKGTYTPLKQFFWEHDYGDPKTQFMDITPEEYEECLRLDELWMLQWYPDTPTGFYCVAASTLEKCLEKAKES